MKKTMNSLLILAIILVLGSCMEIDNFDEPKASITGKLIDSTTGENYLTDQADTHIRIWEKSYSNNPTPQDLAVKMDGTYNNDKLFNGTYDMLPNDGSYWPCDTLRNVPIGNKNHATQDFTVTPYLKIKDFKCELAGDTIVMSCRLFAPIPTDLPQVLEVRPFLSLNHYCGAANHIDYYYSNDYRISIRKTWDKIGDVVTGEGRDTYTIKCPVKAGYIYYCRMGANVKDTNQKFNYSEVMEIKVPQ